MRLQQPTAAYARSNETERNRTLEQADGLNHKRNQDVEFGAGRAIVSSPDGTRYEIGVANGGAVIVNDINGVLILRSGVATLDFADNSNEATVDVTGVVSTLTTSVINVDMRIEATADNSVNDLLIDPIRVTVTARSAGVGFTIYGTMDHGPAQGLYKVDWSLA